MGADAGSPAALLRTFQTP